VAILSDIILHFTNLINARDMERCKMSVNLFFTDRNLFPSA